MARRELFPVSDAARPESTARVENPAVRVDFDPGFFGLTVDQAAQVHPEQRLLLELAWEALEDAGIAPDRLAAERVRAEIDAHWDGRERLLFRTALDFATRGGLSPSRTSISHTPNTRTPSTLAGRDTSHTDWPGRAMEEAAQLLTDGAATLVLAGSTDGRTGGFLVLRTLADADGNGERVRGVLQGSDIVDRPAAAPASLPAPESVPAAASALGAPTAHGAVPGLEVAPRAVPLVLSAAAAPALRRQAERLRDLLTPGEKAPEVPLARTGHALATTRATTLAHRAVLLARSAADARDSLTVLAAGGAAKGLVQGGTTGPGQASERGGFGGAERVGESGEVVFVFPVHGPQREGMAAELLDTAPVFVRRKEECAQALEPFVDWSLLDVIRGRNGAPGMDRVDVSQPALWAVTVSLAALWESYGVRPAAIVGHSIGEWAAACVAGVLSLSDGARVAASWTRHLAGLVGRGDMAWVNLPEGEAAVRLASWPDRIWIAAVNGLQEVVVSGYPDAVADLLAELAADGIRARKLRLGLSAHTPHIDEILPPIAEELAGLAPRPATVPLHSSIPAHAMGPVSMTDAEYWRRCVREPVDFGAVCRELAADGKRFFVELSPHPTLVTAMAATFEEAGHDAVALGTLRRGHGDLETFHTSLADAYVQGVEVDWSAAYQDAVGAHVDLPPYPFQRRACPVDDRAAATDGTVHRELWAPAMPGAEPGRLPGRWLLVVPPVLAPGIADTVAGTLERAGAQVLRTAWDGTGPLPAELSGGGRAPLAGVVSLLALGGSGSTSPGGALDATAALLRGLSDAGRAPLWCLTRGAVQALPDDGTLDADQAALWGFGRVAALEYPAQWGGLVDLTADVDGAPDEGDGAAGEEGEERTAALASAFAAALSGRIGTGRVALRGTALFVPFRERLADAGAQHGEGGEAHGDRARGWRAQGTVLRVGASRDETAGWLSSRGAERFVDIATPLAGPESRTPAAGTAVDTVLVGIDTPAQADLADPREPSRFGDLLRSTAQSLAALDDLLEPSSATTYALICPPTGTVGEPGSAPAAALHAYLDAVARNRRTRGLPATLVAADTATLAGTLARALDDDHVALMSGFDDAPFTAVRPTYRTEPDAAGPSDLAEELAGLSRPEQELYLLQLVRETAADVLASGTSGRSGTSGHSGTPRHIAPDRTFLEAGFDSMAAVELRNRLAARTGLRLPVTAVFNHPTPLAMAHLLHTRITGPDTVRTAPPSATGATGPDRSEAEDDDLIAIVSMGCRFPGGVATPEQLWQLVAAGGDAVTELPTDRGWDIAERYDPEPGKPGRFYQRAGGFLHDAGDFDPAPFGIGPREALAMDPQQRLLLETSWEVLERAGVDPATLRGSDTGVFVGAIAQDYGPRLHEAPTDLEGYLLTGNLVSVTSGRLAYTFAFEGPAVTVDSACSSSLVALHLAVRALRAGECSLALAGGVTVLANPGYLTEFSRKRALAPDGRSKPFSAGGPRVDTPGTGRSPEASESPQHGLVT